jgi:hypothetical protein
MGISMQLAKLAIAFGSVVLLAGCFPQSPTATTGSMNQTAQYNLLYGSAEPVHIRRTVSNLGLAVTSKEGTEIKQSADTSAVVFSDQWWNREKEAENKLSQSAKICRC